jgi:hypothetical protein
LRTVSKISPWLIEPNLLFIALVGGIIVAIGPCDLALGSVRNAFVSSYDLAFSTVTHGSAVYRVVLFELLVLAGAFCAQRTGLMVGSYGIKQPILIGLAAACGVAIAVACLDGFLMRGALSASYVELFRSNSTGWRLLYFLPRALIENVFYRLVLCSVLAYLAGIICGSKTILAKPAVMIVVITAAQIINIWINVVLPSTGPLNVNILIYDALRYVLPGVAWGVIYWRYGFFTVEIASVGCHIFLQPMLGGVLAL